MVLKMERGIKKEITDKTEQERYQTGKQEKPKRDSCYMEAKLGYPRRLSIKQRNASRLSVKEVESMNLVMLNTE